MKNFILVLCALVAVMALTSFAYASEMGDDEYVEMGGYTRLPVVDADKIPYGSRPINKLDRGIVNGATFWSEVPAEVARVSKEQDPLMGFTVGIVHGTITGVVRAGSALFDTLTFFVPPYDKPVMKPEYAYKRCDDKIKDLLW
jgi:putative exosortase-associated protein (TIGR04073 family)